VNHGPFLFISFFWPLQPSASHFHIWSLRCRYFAKYSSKRPNTYRDFTPTNHAVYPIRSQRLPSWMIATILAPLLPGDLQVAKNLNLGPKLFVTWDLDYVEVLALQQQSVSCSKKKVESSSSIAESVYVTKKFLCIRTLYCLHDKIKNTTIY